MKTDTAVLQSYVTRTNFSPNQNNVDQACLKPSYQIILLPNTRVVHLTNRFYIAPLGIDNIIRLYKGLTVSVMFSVINHAHV